MTPEEATTRAGAALDQAEDILLSVDEPSAVKYAAEAANGFLDLAALWLRVAWSALPVGHPDRDDLILAERAAMGTLPAVLRQRSCDLPELAARAFRLRTDSDSGLEGA